MGGEIEASLPSKSDEPEHLAHQGIFLAPDVIVQGSVPNLPINRTLHHCASIVVLDVAFVARLRQRAVFIEALLLEIAYRIVVRIC